MHSYYFHSAYQEALVPIGWYGYVHEATIIFLFSGVCFQERTPREKRAKGSPSPIVTISAAETFIASSLRKRL